MAFASGPMTFRRFYISGSMPKMGDESIVSALAGCAFGRYGSAEADGSETGWIAPDHLFDTDMTAEKILFDRFVYVQMRLDRTAPPSRIIRSYESMEEQAALETSGKEFLSKREKMAAREAAAARASEESRSGLFRRISAVPVLIDLRAGVVYLGTSATVAADKFILLFRDTFDAALEPATSEHLAYRIMNAAGDPRSVEDATPVHFASTADAHDAGEGGGMDQSFLGREFLTWVWFKTDRGQSLFDSGSDRITVMISGHMHLDCDFRLSGSDTIRSQGPASTPEARAALVTGKQPTRVGLTLGCKSGEYSLTLDGPRFTVSALKLPDSSGADRRGRFEERFEQMTEVSGLLDVLFGLFLGQRASRDWAGVLSAMQAWAREPNAAATPPAKASNNDDALERSSNVILKMHGQTS